MAKQLGRNLLAAVGLMVLTSCGGGEPDELAFADATTPEAVADQGTAEDTNEPSSSTTTAETPEAESSTPTSEEPEEVESSTTTGQSLATELSVEEAIATYDAYSDKLVSYTEALFVDMSATPDDMAAVLAELDPALVDGNIDVLAASNHDCLVDFTTLFGGLTEFNVEIEHVAQHRINSDTIAVEIRSLSLIHI